MTASIDKEQRQQATVPPRQPADRSTAISLLIRGVKTFAVTTAVAGAASLGVAFALGEWRTALAGSTLVILSVVASSVWIVNALLADREDFYRRGQADGWYRGWRGQVPTVDDPLLRR